jgi:hypothetical protein
MAFDCPFRYDGICEHVIVQKNQDCAAAHNQDINQQAEKVKS